MRIARIIVLSLLMALVTVAEEGDTTPEQVVESVQLWFDQNLADWVYDAAGLDPQAVQDTLETVQIALRDSPPTEIDPRKRDAEQVLQLLGEFDVTRDYASRLQLFLNQFAAPSEPTNVVIRPPSRLNPVESREVWLDEISKRPVPSQAWEFLPETKQIFQNKGIPAELAWLAEVESSFNPVARSPVGAVGLFQLMPTTARSLGLSVHFPDERKNPWKNAGAAADYLRYLHNRFGDWQLALAAYNAGPTRIARLLRQSSGTTYKAIADRVPLETLAYVAKVEATLKVREGVDLSQLDSGSDSASN